jgi:hypothetical protein
VTGTTPGACEGPPRPAGRMRATAAGPDARVRDTRGVLDIAATLHRPGLLGHGRHRG